MKLNWVALQLAFPESHQKLFTTNILFAFLKEAAMKQDL